MNRIIIDQVPDEIYESLSDYANAHPQAKGNVGDFALVVLTEFVSGNLSKEPLDDLTT